MGLHFLTHALAFSLLITGLPVGQSPQTADPIVRRTSVVALEFAGLPSPPDAPQAPGAWSIQIAIRGGLSSSLTSITTISSAGIVTCGAQTTDCRTTLGSSELTTLSELVSQSWPAFVASPASVCSDCPRFYLLLNHRDANGTQQQYAVRWDPTNAASVPEAVRRLFASATTVARPEAR